MARNDCLLVSVPGSAPLTVALDRGALTYLAAQLAKRLLVLGTVEGSGVEQVSSVNLQPSGE
jgi:hypothetical protein